MVKFGEFVKALAKRWWALMGCAAFTFLSVYVVVAGKTNTWFIGATAIVAAMMFVIAAYLAWLEQYEGRQIAEEAICDGRPLFTLEIVQQPSWQTQNPKYAVFKLTNCGKRAARFVRLDSQQSKLRGHAMDFVQLPLLSPGNSETLAYAIDQHGADQRALCEFLEDNAKDAALVWWDIKVTFRDANDAQGTDTIRLCFDVQLNVLYTTAVPYTMLV